MRTVGILLKEERLKKGFTLEQVEKATKIRLKFLKDIEADDYRKIPSLPYIQGFIKNYSDFLGLKSWVVMAIFRRQFNQKTDRKEVEQIEEPLTSSQLLTRNKVMVGVVVILIFSLFTYFYFQFRALHAPPPLILEQPKDEVVVGTKEIAVFGNTDPDATITINNEPILIKEDGKFYKDMPLSVGVNTLVVEATSRAGEKTKITRRVTLTP